MFSDGEYVMYGGSGVCRIDGKEKRSFDGIHETEYCKLIPYSSEHSVYYIPADTIEQKVRRLISKEDIYSLIDRLPEIEEMWDSDSNKRKEIFGSLLKSGNYDKIFCLVKSVYNQRRKITAAGRKLASADEKAMKAAENIINQEFSVVLGIKPEEVIAFISERLEA